MYFSLVIPCYNEAKNIPLLLERCNKLAYDKDMEIILVDNGSTDDSPAILAQLLPTSAKCRSIRVHENKGYGNGILEGLRSSRGEILGWTHADMQTDPADAISGLQFFETYGNNIFVKGKRHGRPITDSIFTIGMSCFETLLLAQPLWDINAQPTMFSRQFFESWEDPPSDFSLDLYAYFEARNKSLAVKRFPVIFSPRVHGTSHWNINWAAKRKFIQRTIKFSLELKRRNK